MFFLSDGFQIGIILLDTRDLRTQRATAKSVLQGYVTTFAICMHPLVLLTQRFNANIFQTQLSRRQHPDTYSTVPSYLPSGHSERIMYVKCQCTWDPEKANDGSPHIGNRAVMEGASRCGRQGIVFAAWTISHAVGSTRCHSTSIHYRYLHIY